MNKFKKLFFRILLTLTILIFQSFNVFAFYSDVPEDHPYFESIDTLYKLGRLPVEADNQFHPDEILTKAELYKLILTYGMANLSKEINLPYKDVDKDSPYATYIQTALDTHILKAPNETARFNPKQKINKKTAITTMFNSLGLGGNYFFTKEDFPFTDLSTESDLAPIAFKAGQLKILEKNDPKKFRRNKKITKAEAVDYLYKIKQDGQQTITFTINTGSLTGNNDSNDLTDNPSFATLSDVWSSLKNKYLYNEEIKDDKLIFGAIKGMVSQVTDKYTVFEEPSTDNGILSKLSTKYEGVGIIIELIDKKVTVVSPFKDSPAEKAGIKAKDIIVKVDGQSTENLTLEEVSAKIKGPSKSTVKLTVNRSGSELEFNVTREFIMVTTITQKILTSPSGKNIGYIDVMNFSISTYEEFVSAADELIKQNPAGQPAGLAGLIIDLRNNPGGYLDVAVKVTGLFVEKDKTIVKLENVNKEIQEYKNNQDGKLKNYKIVVLVNEGSASASEIMAGALQDYKTATLIGKKTFGKGTAQELKSYSDGSTFKYTVSSWITPNGTKINGTGITPDKIVDNTETSTDNQLNAALAEF